jgi:membrane protein
MKEIIEQLKQTLREFQEDQCPRMAAALSYYTVFSLPPLLILLLQIVGLVLDPHDVQGALEKQIGGLVGSEGANEVQTIIAHADKPGAGGGPLATIIGVAALIFGATGAFTELQAALNRAWEVVPDPKQGGFKNFLVKRVFSFGMVLGIAFLLLVSLVLSTALAALGNALTGLAPGGVSEVLLHAVNLAISLGVITVLFAAIFRLLPDATIAWKDVWAGAFTTAVLFVGGKFVIGLYLGNSNPGSAFGAAGSLAILLLWIYYSSMILLFGAEFTQVWAERRGRGFAPEPGAMRLQEQQG